MARQIQIADVLYETGTDGELQIRYGTSLWRLQDAIDNEPMDQESTAFYAGDIRDVCNACDGPKPMRDAVKGKAVGESIVLKIADVKQLIATARKPQKSDPATN